MNKETIMKSMIDTNKDNISQLKDVLIRKLEKATEKSALRENVAQDFCLVVAFYHDFK